MADIFNDFFCIVFTGEDVENIPELEKQYLGENPLSTVAFMRDKVKDKLAKL